MTTTYGYVILKFQVFPGQKRTELNFQNAGEFHFLDVLLEDLKKLRDRGTLGEIRASADDEDDEDEASSLPNARLTRIETVKERGWTISFEARYGRIGSHDIAMTDQVDGEDIYLGGHAPSRNHRGLFVIPPVGDMGLVAIEVIGRSQPLDKVVRWLKQVSDVPWRIRTARSSDEEAFLQALQASQEMYVELEKVQPGEDSTPGSNRLKVHAPVTTASRRKKVVDRVYSWINQRDQGIADPAQRKPLDGQTEARNLATIAEPEMRDVSFDDGKVVIEDADGVKRVFRPELRFNLFTYYLGDSRPSNDTFYSRVRFSMARQFYSLDIDMPADWQTTRD